MVNSGYKHFVRPLLANPFVQKRNFTKRSTSMEGWADRKLITGKELSTTRGKVIPEGGGSSQLIQEIPQS